MQYTGYVADIDDDVDAAAVDFETTDYCTADAALVSQDRIRLEWTEGDVFWAVTVEQLFENEEGEFGTGKVECTYDSWESRKVQVVERGEVTAIVIAGDDETEYYMLDEFWLDVKWTTGRESGRLLFELQRQRDE